VGYSGRDKNTERRLLSLLENKIADAACLIDTALPASELSIYNERQNIALAFERVQGAKILTVTADNEAAAFAAVSFLISKGHRKIGFLTASGSSQSAVDKRQGYENALEEAEITYREEYVYMADANALPKKLESLPKTEYSTSTEKLYDAGVKAYRYFSKLIDPPTAILCINDILAASLIKCYLTDSVRGHRFNVMGFDDTLLSKALTPAITVATSSAYDVGFTAVNKLIEKKSNPQSAKHIKLPFKIVERDSV
jgi:LacI family transcriptional regulator